MPPNAEILGIVVSVILLAFGALFFALRMVLTNGIANMKDTMQDIADNMDRRCKLISSNLHANMVDETKRRVAGDERVERDFKSHGHRGLDNGQSKVTI